MSETEKEVERNIRGKIITSKEKKKAWISPLAEYRTPMNHALTLAAELLESWIVQYSGKDVYPPIVFNITDGELTDATEKEVLNTTKRIKQLRTIDGNVLLFNMHISAKNHESVIFPTKKSELPDDKNAHLLFDMSSDLPDIYNRDIATLKNTDLMTFTGMSYNSSLSQLVSMMNIGTSTTTRQIQQTP